MGLYLLPLLDGGHRVWLELQLVRPAQLPVEDGEDDEDHQQGDHHADDDPHVGVLGAGGRRRRFLHSCGARRGGRRDSLESALLSVSRRWL